MVSKESRYQASLADEYSKINVTGRDPSPVQQHSFKRDVCRSGVAMGCLQIQSQDILTVSCGFTEQMILCVSVNFKFLQVQLSLALLDYMLIPPDVPKVERTTCICHALLEGIKPLKSSRNAFKPLLTQLTFWTQQREQRKVVTSHPHQHPQQQYQCIGPGCSGNIQLIFGIIFSSLLIQCLKANIPSKIICY